MYTSSENIHLEEGEAIFFFFFIQDIHYYNYKELIKKKIITMF